MEEKLHASRSRALLTPALVREHMRKLWDNNPHVLRAVCG